MEKQDILYGILALAIIVVVALVIKPIATGEPIEFGMPTPTSTSTEVPVPPITTYVPPAPQKTVTTFPTTVPTPTPLTPGSTVVFVDPSQYGISLDPSLPGGTRINETLPDTSLTTLSTISGRYSGTTDTFFMPYPYWELWYTVEPSGSTAGREPGDSGTSTSSKTSTKSDSSTGSSLEGAYSVTFPKFTLQVMDGNDPNRIVRTVTPPGGIDKDLWEMDLDTSSDSASGSTTTTSGKTSTSSTSDSTKISLDPRPWNEKFFEGERSYFFIITTQSLDSYTIEIKVPTRYIANNTAPSK